MKALVFLQFEDAVEMNKFLEYGEYDGAYYGTRFDSIRSVIKSGKICILDLNPQVCLCRIKSFQSLGMGTIYKKDLTFVTFHNNGYKKD